MIVHVGATRIPSFDGARVRAAREAKSWTQGRLAALVDVSVGTVSAWERGDRAPEPPTFIALASALDVTAADLLDLPQDQWSLIELRVTLGMHQHTAARTIGVPTSRLSYFESGYERLDSRARSALGELYGVDEETISACWQRGRDRITADS